MNILSSTRISIVVIISLFCGSIHADDWPQWRGPNRNAISTEQGLLQQWSTDKPPPTRWQASGLGGGYAGVVVSGGMVFTIGAQGSNVFCTALDEQTGQQRWSTKIGETQRNPCSTPTVDGKHIFTLDPDGDLVCLQTNDGKIIWKISFLEDFSGRMMSGRGYGESPLIVGDRLICTPGGENAMLVALNKRTGQTIWQATMPAIGEAGRDGAGFSSIVATEAAGISQYVQLVGRGLIGVAAADGRFLWGYNDVSNQTANIPTPVVRGNLVFAANGYNAGSVLIRLVPSPTGGVDTEEVYRLNASRFQNHHGGFLALGDHIFGGHGSNNGLPTCLDLMTGRVQWKRRGPGIGSAAVIFADGHLYFRYQNGVMALIEATPDEYRLKGTFEIPGSGGDSWAHPAIANGRLYLREQDELWVYDLKISSSPLTARPKTPGTPSTKLTALRKLGVSVETMDRQTSSESLILPDLFGYLKKHSPSSPSPLVITLTNQHLTSEGTIEKSVKDKLLEFSQTRVVNLAGTKISDAGLKQVIQDVNMVGLNLDLCPKITDQGMRHLKQANQLEVLVLAGTQVTDTGLAHLTKLKSLVGLDLAICDGISDEGCKILGDMQPLIALVLNKTGFESNMITGKGLKWLSRLSQLRRLDLYGNGIDDSALVHLIPMKQLQELDLSLLPITDTGLATLKSLDQLRHLKLLYSTGFSGPTITDKALPSLAGCTKLETVDLTGARITDEGLQFLTVLKELTSLKLVNTNVTDRGIHKLHTVLPECEIER